MKLHQGRQNRTLPACSDERYNAPVRKSQDLNIQG